MCTLLCFSCLRVQFFQYVIAAGVLAGGFFSYTLFSSAPPQPGALIKASVSAAGCHTDRCEPCAFASL